jgi:hypothetical protein
METAGRYLRTRLERQALIALLLFATASSAVLTGCKSKPAAAPAKTEASNVANPDDFVTFYPGQYTEKEKAPVEKLLASNKAINDRGPIDVKALIAGKLTKENTPGYAGSFKVTEAMVRYNNAKYDKNNKLLNDAAYAKSLGYQDIFPYITFAACDDMIMAPFPGEARDTLLVSQLNHEIQSYKPIYPGDTIYTVVDERDMYEITPPEGSIYRSELIVNKASLYNQKGEKVQDVVFRVVEALKQFKPGKKPADFGVGRAFWEAPDWKIRPAHVYTDKDWETIKDLWSKEHVQGETPLYWEDVKIGDKPAWTVDGPVLSSAQPSAPYGMGTGGTRTLKDEIMDANTFKTMSRDEGTGIWLLPNAADYTPAVPDQKPGPGAPVQVSTTGTKDIHKQIGTERAALINYYGRDLAFRNVYNWMGYHGQVTDIRWGIMEPETHAAFGKIVQKSPQYLDFLSVVPELNGKHINAHGLSTDLGIVKSYVYNKYIENGEHYAELAFWVETIDGYIWEAGRVTVKLPSKQAK